MEKQERLRKIINWLIFTDLIESQNGLAALLGYSSSYMSQVASGAKVASDSLVEKICSLDNNLSFEWAVNGTGEMFKNNPFSVSTPSTAADAGVPPGAQDSAAWDVIKAQTASLAARDRQVDELIALLRDQIEENKKRNVRRDDHAGCADAV